MDAERKAIILAKSKATRERNNAIKAAAKAQREAEQKEVDDRCREWQISKGSWAEGWDMYRIRREMEDEKLRKISQAKKRAEREGLKAMKAAEKAEEKAAIQKEKAEAKASRIAIEDKEKAERAQARKEKAERAQARKEKAEEKAKEKSEEKLNRDKAKESARAFRKAIVGSELKSTEAQLSYALSDYHKKKNTPEYIACRKAWKARSIDKYICEECNYSTNDYFNLRTHFGSAKHHRRNPNGILPPPKPRIKAPAAEEAPATEEAPAS